MAALKPIHEIKKAEDKAREMIRSAESQAAKALEEAKWRATDEIDQQRKASIRMEGEATERATGEAQGDIERTRERGQQGAGTYTALARENMDEVLRQRDREDPFPGG
jgi:vacuolar-type H+-ATPase subunit H